MRAGHRAGLSAMGFLLLVGCSMDNPSVASQHVQLKQGEVLGQTYRLVRITAEGKAEFHNIDAGDDSTIFPHFAVGAGQSFALEVESRHRTTYNFTVEQIEPAKQEVTVLVRTTKR